MFFPGRCHCRKNRETGQRFCRIEMSSKVLDDSERLRDTLIHEICHAAVWIISEENDVIIWNSCSRNFNFIKNLNVNEPKAKCLECVNFWVKLNWSEVLAFSNSKLSESRFFLNSAHFNLDLTYFVLLT